MFDFLSFFSKGGFQFLIKEESIFKDLQNYVCSKEILKIIMAKDHYVLWRMNNNIFSHSLRDWVQVKHLLAHHVLFLNLNIKKTHIANALFCLGVRSKSRRDNTFNPYFKRSRTKDICRYSR